MSLHHALRAELPQIVDVWVEAFADDPYLRWASEGAAWSDFGPEWMAFIAGLCFERGHTFLGAEAAIAWIPPDLSLASPEAFETGRSILARHAGEDRAGEAVAAILAARAHEPAEPHWTLQYVGVRSPGRGLGAAAIAPTLEVVDRDGMPCGLTSTNARNLPFHERHGFRVIAEVPTPDGAATLRPMVRRP